jgi:hypothetical protein
MWLRTIFLPEKVSLIYRGRLLYFKAGASDPPLTFSVRPCIRP